MTFGRWLLTHSFSIFLLILIFIGYFYRDQLQLEKAYEQLLMMDVVSESINDSNSKEKVPPKDIKPDLESPKKENSIVQLESVPTISRNLPDIDILLLSARQAYWDRDYQKAIYKYQQLIQSDNNNPDFRGELGNIYYSLNDYPNASNLYYQAALILIEQNQHERARLLISPITVMNRDLGDRLKHQLYR